VKLIFLSLAGPDLAVARVAARVRQGGHDVPEDAIRRRFESGLRNFERFYKPLVDSWVVYDNSGPIPRRLTAGENS
jgi:predicted ABC-type ATPase